MKRPWKRPELTIFVQRKIDEIMIVAACVGEATTCGSSMVN
jgi:hypothetical protein